MLKKINLKNEIIFLQINTFNKEILKQLNYLYAHRYFFIKVNLFQII